MQILENGVIILKEEKYVVRFQLHKCVCDTMEKGLNCSASIGFDHCARIKYVEYEVDNSNILECGEEKTHRPHDGVEGVITSSNTFLIKKNWSSEQRNTNSADVVIIESFADKLKKLQEKYK